MSKRDQNPAKVPKQRSASFIIAIWVGSVLSLLLLWAAASAFVADMWSLRSCNGNSGSLLVTNCGKQSLNPGDLMLFILLALSACLTVSLFTAAWRISRRKAR